jgi:hypothetical protein
MPKIIFTKNEVTILKILAAAVQGLDNVDGLVQVQSNNCAYYTLAETAEILGYKPKTVYNRLSRNSSRPFPLKPIRNHGRLQFLKSDVHDYVRKSAGKDVV